MRYPRQREQELADQLAVVLQRYSGQAMGDIDARSMLSEIFQTVYRLQLTLPTRWVMLDKTLATLAGVALQLSPEFNVFESARPYARRLMAERLRPDRVAERARRDLERGVRVAREFPLQVSELLTELTDGEFTVGINVDQLAPSVERIERGMNRLVLALLAFGLMVSSAIIGALAAHARGGRRVCPPGSLARLLRVLPDRLADVRHPALGEVVVAWVARRVPYDQGPHPSRHA